MLQCTKAKALWKCGQKIIARMGCLQALLLLTMRLWMADIFWKSGLTKIMDWDKTISLFAEEYKVPVLPPELAAFMATAVELSCPILLVLGLGTRLAMLPMLCMVAVIQMTYPNPEHLYWAMLLVTLLCFGSGKISVDYWLAKKCAQKCSPGNPPQSQCSMTGT